MNDNELKKYEVQTLMFFSHNEVIMVEAKNKVEAWRKAKVEAAKESIVTGVSLIVEELDDVKLLDINELKETTWDVKE